MGAGSPTFPHDIPVGCDAALLALKNAFSAKAAAGLRLVLELRFETATFRVTVDDETIDIGRGSAERPAATIDTDPVTLEEIAFGSSTIDAAERAGSLRVDGDHRLVERFFELFPVPATSRG